MEILREQYTTRGGGVEISLDSYGYAGEKMTAYQNYLGGGMLGSVQNDCTIRDWQGNMELVDIAMELKILFCRNMGLTPDFLDCNRPASAY
jgi:hypothetical protein|tara:strand:- start:163 stop:435 length:273 start_codon:yes stop_codon:yes gene_type:complete